MFIKIVIEEEDGLEEECEERIGRIKELLKGSLEDEDVVVEMGW